MPPLPSTTPALVIGGVVVKVIADSWAEQDPVQVGGDVTYDIDGGARVTARGERRSWRGEAGPYYAPADAAPFLATLGVGPVPCSGHLLTPEDGTQVVQCIATRAPRKAIKQGGGNVPAARIGFSLVEVTPL